MRFLRLSGVWDKVYRLHLSQAILIVASLLAAGQWAYSQDTDNAAVSLAASTDALHSELSFDSSSSLDQQRPPNPPPDNANQTRDAQRTIEREARKLRAGVRGGVALDPELLLVGVQAQFGPIFKSNVTFRPSLEFAYGEVTAMFGLNAEFIYQLPLSSRQDRWAPYFGGGLGVNFLHQNFERDSGGKRIDFGDFHSDSALNVLGGVSNPNGLFMELRTSIYSDPSPTLRLVIGYNF